MAFWSDTLHTDPKRQYRFTVQIGGSLSLPSYAVKKADKPSFAISEAEHKFLNHTYYYPGRVTWNAITVTLVDPGGTDDIAKLVSTIIQSSGYVPGSAQNMGTMSKQAAVGVLGNVVITQINSEGNPMETWTLVNAWVNDVKYGDLAYDGDELTEVTLSFKYDWAELKIGETPAAFKR